MKDMYMQIQKEALGPDHFAEAAIKSSTNKFKDMKYERSQSGLGILPGWAQVGPSLAMLGACWGY
eukprot:9756710-Karenia_brevis.AAC.1